ncbi:MAG: hypothetical protein KIS78_06280 [Labilithrix sp.]|nr:hypothetical protein [Labilithrix sp.]MCW5832045.1 hypothetical protein [Labilithrix sp.]
MSKKSKLIVDVAAAPAGVEEEEADEAGGVEQEAPRPNRSAPDALNAAKRQRDRKRALLPTTRHDAAA